MDDFPIALRGDDSVEWILPGSQIQEAVVTNIPEEEHDYLPPLEAPPDMSWFLSDETARRLLDLFDEEERLAKASIHEYLQELCDGLGATVEERDPPRRLLRKRIRWDERNRRRKLKGLPKKNNPYWGAVYYVIHVPVYQTVNNVSVEIDGLTKEQAEDMARIVEEGEYDAE